MSAAAALILGQAVATWAFSVPLLVWVQLSGWWTDRRISVLTLAIDLVIVMVSALSVRASGDQMVILKRAVYNIGRQTGLLTTGLDAIRSILDRIETKKEEDRHQLSTILDEIGKMSVRMRRMERALGVGRKQNGSGPDAHVDG